MESVLTFEGFRACVTVLMFPIYKKVCRRQDMS